MSRDGKPWLAFTPEHRKSLEPNGSKLRAWQKHGRVAADLIELRVL
jgi:hypothetical protein